MNKKIILLSLTGHLAAFGIFIFSFNGASLPRAYPGLNFWGSLLPGFALRPAAAGAISAADSPLPGGRRQAGFAALLPRPALAATAVLSGAYKPALALPARLEKETADEARIFPLPILTRKSPEIFFRPILPYSFPLYFKDRQVAHVELLFKILPERLRSSILLKRKISSGNLEVDLLSVRYISHYLFLRQGAFAPGAWQVVKVDLSK
jgi:hypothetical protein